MHNNYSILITYSEANMFSEHETENILSIIMCNSKKIRNTNEFNCHLLTVSDNLFKSLIHNGGGIIDQRQGFLFLPLTGQLANTFWYIAVTLIYVILILKFPTVMINQKRDYKKKWSDLSIHSRGLVVCELTRTKIKKITDRLPISKGKSYLNMILS